MIKYNNNNYKIEKILVNMCSVRCSHQNISASTSDHRNCSHAPSIKFHSITSLMKTQTCGRHGIACTCLTIYVHSVVYAYWPHSV